ncbi:MAG: hypothetical protein V1773_07545 [bacterium]
MKNFVAYFLAFLMAFFGVTGLLFYANTQYKNIFKFDFSSTTPPEKAVKKITLKIEDYQKVRNFIREKFTGEVVDSIKKLYWETKTDTVYKVIVQDSTLKQNLSEIKKQNETLVKQIAAKEEELKKIKNKGGANKDSTYKEWVKQTVKLYETMDSKQAAKIISELSDNVARDLIYTMKKKKAAEILSNMSTARVTKLTGAN